MKRKPFILVAFLLCLYLIPTFASAASWVEVTSADMEFDTPGWNTVTNTELKFVTPDPPSDQSITGFVGTLPDDVLYYPDSFFENTTESLATNGDDDYDDSLAVDAVTWVVTFGTHETIIFDYDTELILYGFTYHHYGYYASAPNPAWCALEYYNSFTDTWDTVMNFTRDTPVNPHWTNDTFYFPNKFTPLALGMRVIASSSDSSTGSTDYLGIEMFYLTTYSNDSYVEPFSDVSEWANSGATISTDGDVATISYAAWLTDYDYRKSHIITGSSGAGTDYQILLNITRATGTDTGNNAFVGTDCQADFDDIRFTDNDGVTELDYWLETSTAEYGMFWVEIADNLDTNQEIYIYYGNAGASTASDGDDTFIFFDDFENNDLNRWTVTGDYWSTQSGVKKYGSYAGYGDAGATAAEKYLTYEFPSSLDYGFMLHTWFRVASVSAGTSESLIRSYEDDLTQCYTAQIRTNDLEYYNGSYGFWEENAIVVDTWYRFEVGHDFVGSTEQGYLNRVLLETIEMDNGVGATITEISKFSSITDTGAGEDHYLDDIYVRKWITTEPTHSTWRNEARIYDEVTNVDYQYYYYSFYAYTTTDTAIQYYSESTWHNLSSSFSTTGQYFGIITEPEATNITRIGVIVSGTVGLDYLRISKANEAGGWGHDCTTIIGTDAVSSDGDNITVSSAVTWDIDSTSNKSIIDKDHFPLMEVRVVSGTGNITIDTYNGTGWDSVLNSTAIEAKTYRFNINAIDNIQNIRLTPTVSFVVAFLNLNSIANWSYYAPNTTIGDYFYTDAGILYSEKSSTESQQLTYDIELSTDTTLFEFVNITTGVWTGDGEYSYGFDYDVGTGWEGYTYDETVVTLEAGTLETIRIITRDSGNISSIMFIDPLALWWESALAEILFRVKDWFLVVTAVLNFLVKLYEFTWFFILAGLVMIPTSTLFLVRGGKDDMSRDKLFLFFLIFLFGWAFVLGGIL